MAAAAPAVPDKSNIVLSGIQSLAHIQLSTSGSKATSTYSRKQYESSSPQERLFSCMIKLLNYHNFICGKIV